MYQWIWVFIIYLVNKGNLHIWYWKNIMTVFVCSDWYRYHHPFIIPLKMILMTWLKVIWFCRSINREYYMALSVSHPASTRGMIRDVIRKEPYHIMFIIYLNMRKSCSVLWTCHVINIILRGNDIDISHGRQIQS